MDNRLGNSHPLLVTAGKIADQPFPEVGNLAQFQYSLYCGGYLPGFLAPQLSGIIQILIHVQIPVHGRLLRQEPDRLFRQYRILSDFHRIDVNLSLRGFDDPANTVHQRRFSGPVRAQQPVNAFPGNLDIYIFYRPLHTVTVRQMLYFYDSSHNSLLNFIDRHVLSRLSPKPQEASTDRQQQRQHDGKRPLNHPELVRGQAYFRVLLTRTGHKQRELPDRKSTRLNSSHVALSRMPSSA